LVEEEWNHDLALGYGGAEYIGCSTTVCLERYVRQHHRLDQIWLVPYMSLNTEARGSTRGLPTELVLGTHKEVPYDLVRPFSSRLMYPLADMICGYKTQRHRHLHRHTCHAIFESRHLFSSPTRPQQGSVCLVIMPSHRLPGCSLASDESRCAVNYRNESHASPPSEAVNRRRRDSRDSFQDLLSPLIFC
jgi:hypothetical protein